MTLTEVKEMLNENNIPFVTCAFQNETEYWRHTALYPYIKNAKSCKVVAIIIQSKNAQRNIELQFNSVDGVFCFEELYFGDYGYELFDCTEETLATNLMLSITKIMEGNIKIIVVNDLKHERWIGNMCFDLCDEDDDAFGKSRFQKAMQKIQTPKGFFAKLLNEKSNMKSMIGIHIGVS